MGGGPLTETSMLLGLDALLPKESLVVFKKYDPERTGAVSANWHLTAMLEDFSIKRLNPSSASRAPPMNSTRGIVRVYDRVLTEANLGTTFSHAQFVGVLRGMREATRAYKTKLAKKGEEEKEKETKGMVIEERNALLLAQKQRAAKRKPRQV